MMRRLIALVVGVVMMIGVAAPAAHASAAVDAALGLGAFAVFNQLVGGIFHPRVAYARPVVVERPAYSYPTVIEYPNGRYELRGDGVYTGYQWVWIPYAPPPPPPPGYPQ
ncbi:MAG TPA: hypothetical protein VGT40_26065 [Methylomirabilota bacterium]|jgi:hypothetical protein|nr:hypothetical protein [Methylomirabilota bacterium]